MTAYQQAQKIASQMRAFWEDCYSKNYGPEAHTTKWAREHGFGNTPVVVWEGGPFKWTQDALGHKRSWVFKALHPGFEVDAWNSFVLSVYNE